MPTVLLSGELRAAPARLVDSLVSVPNAGTWADADYEWGRGINVLSEDRPVFIIGPDFFQEGDGTDYGGTPIPCRLVRTGLTVTGKGRKGDWNVDTTSVKQVNGIWPVIRGTPGTVVKIRLGAADGPAEANPVRWDVERNFIVGQDLYLDYVISGIYIAISFRSEGQPPWELLSYDVEMEVVGQH